MQSVPIATKVVSLNPTHSEVYSIQHYYMIEFVSDLWQIGDFLSTLVSSTNKTDRHNITEMLLKVMLNTIKLQIQMSTSIYKLFITLVTLIVQTQT
jgi:hypothetical protein